MIIILPYLLYKYKKADTFVSTFWGTDQEDMLSELDKLCKNPNLDTIQLGYDVEPFQNQSRGLEFIKQTLKFNKNITFATKAELTDKTCKSLGLIREKLDAEGKYLCAVVSFSCWDSAHKIEPNAPLPPKRLNTVKRLSKYGVPVIIALKPILPFVPLEEFIKLIDEVKIAGAKAIVVAELNLDKKGDILKSINNAGYKIDKNKLGTGNLRWTTNPELEWFTYRDSRISKIFQYAKSVGLPPYKQTIQAVNRIIKDKL